MLFFWPAKHLDMKTLKFVNEKNNGIQLAVIAGCECALE